MVKYYLLLTCFTASLSAMDTPSAAPLQVTVSIAVVDYDSLPCFINFKTNPACMQLPGGIVPQDKSAIQAALDHLKEQTGIEASTALLKLIAQVKRFDQEKRSCLDHYYLVDNERLRLMLTEEQKDDEEFHITNRSISELVNRESFNPRLREKPVPVGLTLQKVAQHIASRCVANGQQEYLEINNDPSSKRNLQLFVCEMKPEKKW